MHNGFSSKCMEGLLIKFYTPSLIWRLIYLWLLTQATFWRLNISTTGSGNHALILVFCLFVTVLFYLTHNPSENISYSLETNQMHIIMFDYHLKWFYSSLSPKKVSNVYNTWFSLAEVSRKIAFISLANAFPSSTDTLLSLCKSLLLPTSTMGTLKGD